MTVKPFPVLRVSAGTGRDDAAGDSPAAGAGPQGRTGGTTGVEPAHFGKGTSRRLLWVLAVQSILALAFLGDSVIDVLALRAEPTSYTFREVMQVAGLVALVASLGLNWHLLRMILAQGRDLQGRVARSALDFEALVAAEFAAWDLSPSERDVALLVIKGFSNPEIAGIMGKSEGTVKTQSNAIFRKAGVNSRVQLVGLIVDRMVGERMIGPEEGSAA